MVIAGGAVAQTAGYVAGLHPDRRPDGAPRLEQVTLAPEQLERALHGIEGPAPGNVESIADTGKWWVPLRGPGMNPPYDLRGWHNPSSEVAASAAAPSSR